MAQWGLSAMSLRCVFDSGREHFFAVYSAWEGPKEFPCGCGCRGPVGRSSCPCSTDIWGAKLGTSGTRGR